MPRRSALLPFALAAALSLHAQWQLPPGTSSSADEATHQAPPESGSATVIQQAEKLLEAQDWKGAAKLLEPLVTRDPKNAHAQYDFGFALDNAGDLAGAEHAYKAAAEADPSRISARVSLGLLLAREGDTAGARKWLREAVALPEDPTTRGARAQAERALARLDLQTSPDQARDELLAAVRLTSEQPEDIGLGAEIAEALHDDAAAGQAYARALQAAPTDSGLAAGYVRVLLRQGKQSEANAALDRALAAHPDSAPLRTEQANLLLQQQKYAEATPLLERLHTADPSDTALTRLLARAYVAAGDPARSNPLFAQLLHTGGNDATLQTDWADSLIRQKRNAEAEQVLTHALSLPFPTPAARANAAGRLAFAASLNGDPEAVVRAVQLHDEILPPEAATTFLLATAHDTLHHTAKAAEKYREFLQLAVQSFPDEVWQAQQRLQVLRRAK